MWHFRQHIIRCMVAWILFIIISIPMTVKGLHVCTPNLALSKNTCDQCFLQKSPTHNDQCTICQFIFSPQNCHHPITPSVACLGHTYILLSAYPAPSYTDFYPLARFLRAPPMS